MAARLVHDLAQLRRQEDSKGPAAHGCCAESVAETPALGTLDRSHHRTCPSTWSPERRSPRRRSSPTASLRWRRSRKRRSRMTSMLSLSANVLFSDAYASAGLGDVQRSLAFRRARFL